MTIKGEIIEVGGGRWKVREAKTREDALNAIASARCSGSVGARQTDDKRLCGGALDVLADVVHVPLPCWLARIGAISGDHHKRAIVGCRD